MRGHGQYADSGMNQMVAGQMHHAQAQRLQHNSGMGHYPERADILQADEEHQYMSLKGEGQWQWDRDGPKGSNVMPPHMYKEGKVQVLNLRKTSLYELKISRQNGIWMYVHLIRKRGHTGVTILGFHPSVHCMTGGLGLAIATVMHGEYGQGGDASRSSYQGRRPDLKVGLEKQSNKGPRDQAHVAEMEVGYEDISLLQTFESLEQKFIQDIMKLTKEQQDAEDLENARHRERLNEINVQYQEKLLAMRVRQATRREDILRQESQARHQQYQQANMNTYQNCAHPSDALIFESYGERANFSGPPRGHGYESRGQYPGGRAYNSGGRNF